MNKMLFDFFPLAIFFAAFYGAPQFGVTDDIQRTIWATGCLIPATLLQMAFTWWKNRKIEKMHLVTLLLVIVFGGATVILGDSDYIQWKPTVANWLFGAAFLGSQFIGDRNFLERMMGGQVELPKPVWLRLNLMWVSFFILMGALNLYVAFSGHFSLAAWVNFKVFGMLGLTIVFVVLQGIYLARLLPQEEPEESSPTNQ